MNLRLPLIAAAAFALVACQQDPRGDVATGNMPATTASMRCEPYVGETPPTVPGARTVTTADVRQMLASSNKPVLIDFAGGNARRSIPGAVWLPGAGMCDREAPQVQRRLEARLAELTGGDKSKSVVVFCPNVSCWLSYNGAMRLARAGYTDVAWYREGTDGWRQGGGRLVDVQRGW